MNINSSYHTTRIYDFKLCERREGDSRQKVKEKERECSENEKKMTQKKKKISADKTILASLALVLW